MSARLALSVPGLGAIQATSSHLRLAGSSLLSEAQWAETARALRFSGRELQIVRGVFDGRTESAIAADLSIAPRTVDTHLERLYRKLTVRTRVGLVLRVMEGILHAQADANMDTVGDSTTAPPARPPFGGVG